MQDNEHSPTGRSVVQGSVSGVAGKCPSKLQSCSQEDILHCFSFRLEFLQRDGFTLPGAEKAGALSNGCSNSSTDAEQKVPCPQRPMTQVLSLLRSVLFTCWCLRLPSTVVLVTATSWAGLYIRDLVGLLTFRSRV